MLILREIPDSYYPDFSFMDFRKWVGYRPYMSLSMFWWRRLTLLLIIHPYVNLVKPLTITSAEARSENFDRRFPVFAVGKSARSGIAQRDQDKHFLVSCRPRGWNGTRSNPLRSFQDSSDTGESPSCHLRNKIPDNLWKSSQSWS